VTKAVKAITADMGDCIASLHSMARAMSDANAEEEQQRVTTPLSMGPLYLTTHLAAIR
jgi:hypothetical protein